jgi:hypothetical protein
MWRMTVQRPYLAQHFWRTFVDIARSNPPALELVAIQMAFYLDLGAFAKYVAREIDRQIAEIATEPESALRARTLANVG